MILTQAHRALEKTLGWIWVAGRVPLEMHNARGQDCIELEQKRPIS